MRENPPSLSLSLCLSVRARVFSGDGGIERTFLNGGVFPSQSCDIGGGSGS